ncbi:hypothetical protein BGX30_001265 [Mortierella sp. GBA39]|nr:hypothetical protein BGX30_001265 [Mortierella sp. GBA39]
MFQDVFSDLFSILYDKLEGLTIFESALRPIVRHELLSLSIGRCSGDGIKEYCSNTFPYIEFPGWTGADSVQAYVDRLKERLPDDEIGPIITAIEGILEIGKWDTVIDKTETMITFWKDRQRRRTLVENSTAFGRTKLFGSAAGLFSTNHWR